MLVLPRPAAAVSPGTPQHRALRPLQTRASKRKTLVLDLDETLVHSSLDGTGQPHFTFPVGGLPHPQLTPAPTVAAVT